MALTLDIITGSVTKINCVYEIPTLIISRLAGERRQRRNLAGILIGWQIVELDLFAHNVLCNKYQIVKPIPSLYIDMWY